MNQNGNRVFVLNMRGQALMPTTQRNARILLKQGKAKIVKYNPFTFLDSIVFKSTSFKEIPPLQT